MSGGASGSVSDGMSEGGAASEGTGAGGAGADANLCTAIVAIAPIDVRTFVMSAVLPSHVGSLYLASPVYLGCP